MVIISLRSLTNDENVGLPRNQEELWEIVSVIWEAIRISGVIESLVQSMHKRIQQCIDQRGGWTSY